MADHNTELNVMDADMDFLFWSSSSGLLQPPNLLLDDDPQSELPQIFRDSFLDGDSDLLRSGDANAAVNTEHSYALSKTISTGSALLDSDVSLWEEDHCDRGGMSGNEGTDNWVDELLSSEALLNANHVAEDEQKAEETSCPSPSNVSVSSDIDVMSPDSTNPTRPESPPISGSRRRKVSGSTSIDKTCEGSSSKNAIAARENRIKKKRYLENLEKKTEELEREKQLMERMAAEQDERIRELQERNMYLENILHNESALSSLLGDLPTTSGVRLSIAGQGGKRKKRRRAGSDEVIPMSRGVCLHVDGQTASLEFCSKCAIMAKGGAP